MAQRLTNSFVNTNIPGSYVNTTVKSIPVGIATTGVVAIIGEAEAGQHFSSENIKENFFSPDQGAAVASKYGAGPIVDAFRALSAPSADAQIPGSASRIYILKTNAGTKASTIVDVDYGVLKAKNWGVDGNNTKYRIIESQAEVTPSVTSLPIAALSNAGATVEIFDIDCADGATVLPGQYFTFQAGNNGTKYYGWYRVDGVGTDPAVSGRTGVLINILSTDTDAQVATKTAAAINALSDFSATSLADIVTVTAAAAGEAEDAVNVNVAGTTITVTQQGGLYDASALNGLSFSLRQNGGPAVTITLGANESDHDTVAELVAELNSLLPAGVTASAGSVANTIVLSMAADPNNHRKGWGKTLELIDSTPGDLAALGLSPGLYKSGAESEIEVSVANSTLGIEENIEVAGTVALEVGYQGTSATLSISPSNILTTTVTGGPGSNLSIDLSQYTTVSDLAAFISSKPGYSASATPAGGQMNPKDLDKVSGIGICATGASLKPGRIKRSLKNFKNAMETSRLVDFEATDVDGLPSPMASYVFLSGGQKGATLGADIVDALAKLESVNVNFVVPLFSRDASLDIADGLTDSASTYTIDAIHAATKNHVLKMSQVKLKKNRIAILSYDGTYSQAETKAQSLASYRCLMTFQKSSQVDSKGNVKMFAPWHTACIAAGMQAGGFYKAIVNKLANVISYQDPVGFDSGSPGDLEKALDAGLLILQQDVAGVRWVSDQSTYGFDTNFVYNSLQATYLADVAAVALADSLQRQFVGQSLADIDRGVVESFISAKMDEYRNLKIIAASDDAPLGYRNVDVKINGPIIQIKLEIKLASAVYFIPVDLEISQVQQGA